MDYKKYAVALVVIWVALAVYDNYAKAPIAKVLPKF